MSLCCVCSHVPTNLYCKSSFRSCPYMVLVKCPVRFYSIFHEIGQNVDDKCIFTTKATAQQYRIERNGSVFNSPAPANAYAQKNCAERFSALNVGGRRVLSPLHHSCSLNILYSLLHFRQCSPIFPQPPLCLLPPMAITRQNRQKLDLIKLQWT